MLKIELSEGNGGLWLVFVDRYCMMYCRIIIVLKLQHDKDPKKRKNAFFCMTSHPCVLVIDRLQKRIFFLLLSIDVDPMFDAKSFLRL